MAGRLVDNRFGGGSGPVVLDIAYNADDGQPRVGRGLLTDLDAMAHGALVRPIKLGQSFADERNGRGVRSVKIVERAPLEQAGAHRREIIRTDVLDNGEAPSARIACRLSFDAERSVVH